jgi:mannose-6-phosphate isomerase
MTVALTADTADLLHDLYGTTELPIRVEKPWGFEIVYAATDKYVGKIIHVNKGHELSLQYHNKKQESNLLQQGRLVLIRGPNALESRQSTKDIQAQLAEQIIEPGHVWTNLPGDVHTVRALVDSEFLEVSTPELDDVVRLKDLYAREGTSKP